MDQHIVQSRLSKLIIALLLIGVIKILVVLPHAKAGCAHDSIESKSLNEPILWSFSIRWENDTFAATDRFYTNGISLSLARTGPGWMDKIMDLLPWGQGRRTVGYDLTQLMLTPADINRSVPESTDRPYAGILSIGLTMHIEQANSYNGLKLIIGVVGPWSLAEHTQREVHHHIGSNEPQGWDYQLENEPILNLVYEYRRKFLVSGHQDGWAFEAIPSAGGWLGNELTQGQIGLYVRSGYKIPDDFGLTLSRGLGSMPPPQNIENSRSHSDWGFSIHGGVTFNAVLWDITLDGNTFKDTPNVEKNIFVPAGGIGITVGNKHFSSSFSYIFWGKEFNGQMDYSKFGAVTFNYIF